MEITKLINNLINIKKSRYIIILINFKNLLIP